MTVLDEHKDDIEWLRAEVERLTELVDRKEDTIRKLKTQNANLRLQILEDGL